MEQQRDYRLTRKISVWHTAVAVASSPQEAAQKALEGDTSDWTYDFDSADDTEFPGELYVSENSDRPDVPASEWTNREQGESS